MARIISQTCGDLRRSVFYLFSVPPNEPSPALHPGADAIYSHRAPMNDESARQGRETYMYTIGVSGWDSRVETRGCPADPTHVTHLYLTEIEDEAFGGKRLSPFIPHDTSMTYVLSESLRRRMEKLGIRGARIDSLRLTDHVSRTWLHGFWALQFVGKVMRRAPKIVGGPNQCPHCGKSKIFCEGCGYWTGSCPFCGKGLAVIESQHSGTGDRRVPFEENLIEVLEGRTWDGSDLVQTGLQMRNYASKRFIDWLLRIHAFPFYAEPVWFCVDGMNDQQKRWLDELQKPFEA